MREGRKMKVFGRISRGRSGPIVGCELEDGSRERMGEIYWKKWWRSCGGLRGQEPRAECRRKRMREGFEVYWMGLNEVEI